MLVASICLFGWWLAPLPVVLAQGGTVRGGVSLSLDHAPRSRVLPEIADFVPLSCNAALATVSCTSWTAKFGTLAVQSKRVIVPCGECIRMDHPGPILTLVEGLDIQGKLVFSDGYRLEVRAPLIAVQGELEMSAFKPVDGAPNVKLVMTGETDQVFTPIGPNANACSGGGCVAGKKAIVVAGGRVTRTYSNCVVWVLCLERRPGPLCLTLCLWSSPRSASKLADVGAPARYYGRFAEPRCGFRRSGQVGGRGRNSRHVTHETMGWPSSPDHCAGLALCQRCALCHAQAQCPD
jgi:G8 domain